MIVAQHDARVLKWHGEIAVESTVRVDHDGDRVDGAGLGVATTEEIADRALHRGEVLAVPVELQNQVA